MTRNRYIKVLAAVMLVFLLFPACPRSTQPSKNQVSATKARSPILGYDTLIETNGGYHTLDTWEKTIETIHFLVQYNTTGPNAVTDQYAINVSDSLEHSWTKEVTDFSFRSPPDSHMNIYVQDIDAYGITYYYGPPYHVQNITIDTNLSVDLIRITSAHELFHTIQLSYDITEKDWIIEGTAAWIESKVYSYYAGTGSYIDYVNAYMADPDRTITTLDFDAAIFWIFIDEHNGGISTLENMLQQTVTKNDINAVNATLVSQGKTFVETFKEFTIASILKDTYYSKGNLFNTITKTSFAYNGTRTQFSTDVADWGAKYCETTSSAIYMETQFLGVGNHNLTRILLEGSSLTISDIKLDGTYSGSFRLMQANLLDKIVVIVRSIANETASERRSYLLVWLGELVQPSGPYEQTSSSTTLNVRGLSLQNSPSLVTEVFHTSTTQLSSTTSSSVTEHRTSQTSAQTTIDAIPSSTGQNSASTMLDCVGETNSQSSSQQALATVSGSSSQVSSQTPVQVGTSPPIASFTYSPLLPPKNETITFDASSSHDPDGFIVSYMWDFGDGNITTIGGPITCHRYTSAGTYIVTLNTTDNQSLWNTVTEAITVYETAGLSIDVENLIITDQNGNPKNDFSFGEVTQFNFTIQNTGSLDLRRGLISVMLLDPTTTPEFLSYTYEDLNIGSSKEFIMGCSIPINGTPGTYTVKIMVFTDWPSKGGIGLAVETSTFTADGRK